MPLSSASSSTHTLQCSAPSLCNTEHKDSFIHTGASCSTSWKKVCVLVRGKKNRKPVCVSANVRRQIKRQTERICVSEVCLNLSRRHLILIQCHQRSRPTKTLTLSFSRPTRTKPHQRESGPDQSTWTRADKHSAQVFSLQTDGWNWSQQKDRPHICTGAWERTRGKPLKRDETFLSVSTSAASQD